MQKTDSNADDVGHSMTLSSNDGNRIVAGADCSNTVFAHEYANHKHVDVFVNQFLFDLEDENRKFGHGASMSSNGNRVAMRSPNSNLHTGNVVSSGRCNIHDIVERSFPR